MSIEPSKLVRPYAVAGHRDDTSIATIILYNTDTTSKSESVDEVQIESLENYESVPNGPVLTSDVMRNFDGTKISQISLDGENQYYGIFDNFIVSRVDESSDEIIKTHLNFSNSWNVFMFGKKPTVMSFTGQFIDTQEHPYFQEFMMAYEKYLSGTKAVQNKMQTVFTIDGRMITGLLIGVNIISSSEQENLKSFSFRVLVKKSKWNRINIVNGNNVLNGMSNIDRIKGSRGIIVPNPASEAVPVTEDDFEA